MFYCKNKRDAHYWKQQAATLPDLVPQDRRQQELMQLQHRASILWSPQLPEQAEEALSEYLDFAFTAYQIEEEQALFILRSQGFDLAMARRRLERSQTARGCHYHRWKALDLVALSKAFRKHGTDFEKVRQQVPHFPVAEVRRYFNFMYSV
ncbi:hypothetical protein KR038_005726 [Drosophila bunnanda]|nr:hypothetical protein KR038_005726 [Drosophila bunnanda]